MNLYQYNIGTQVISIRCYIDRSVIKIMTLTVMLSKKGASMSLGFMAQTAATSINDEGNKLNVSVVLRISEDTSYLEIKSESADVLKKGWTLILSLEDLRAAIATLEGLRKE